MCHKGFWRTEAGTYLQTRERRGDLSNLQWQRVVSVAMKDPVYGDPTALTSASSGIIPQDEFFERSYRKGFFYVDVAFTGHIEPFEGINWKT